MIHVDGCNGESISLDGLYILKFRHHGKDQAARNLAHTFRGATVTAKKRQRNTPQKYDVMIACSSFMSLTILETERPALDALIHELERIADT